MTPAMRHMLEGLVRDEFVGLVRTPDRSPEQEQRVTFLEHEMADRLIALPAKAVYDARVIADP